MGGKVRGETPTQQEGEVLAPRDEAADEVWGHAEDVMHKEHLDRSTVTA